VTSRYDPRKDVANLEKHGLSLARADDIDLGQAAIIPDDRRDYRERRWRAYAMLDGRLHMLAFTIRDGAIRPISLRKANAREQKNYG
jgi:hypothetical protein